MQAAVKLAQRMSKQLDKNWLLELEELNLYRIFEPVYKLSHNITTLNTLVCAIIYSYSPTSSWIDLKKDSYSINKEILLGLNADFSELIFEDFCTLSNEDITDCVGLYLDSLTNWKFVTIKKMVDFHSRTMREREPDLTNVDEDKKPKVRENISRTMREALFQMETAEKLIEQLEKEYVLTNHKTKQDFGANYTEKTLEMAENKPLNILSWREFIRSRKK